MGTIISGADEVGLTRKERKETIADELLSSQKSREYIKRRVKEVVAKRSNVTRKGWTKKARK